jgi:glutaconate CoA-transferase, subunit A
MPRFVPSSLESIAAAIPDGALLAIPKDSSGAAMAVTRELIRRAVRKLHLLCVPTSGIQADVLIGVGAVETIETSAVTLGEFGPAPCFTAAVRDGTLKLKDATCPAVYAALQAGEKGLPFIPLRGLIGSDVLRHRADWQTIQNPFAPGDAIVVLPALRPDVALFHTPLADREGNVFIGRQRDLMTMAHAARQTFVTVEEIADCNLLEDPARAGSVLPAIYVSQIAAAPRGAWPLALWNLYGEDEPVVQRYATMARTREGFARFIAEWVNAARVAA